MKNSDAFTVEEGYQGATGVVVREWVVWRGAKKIASFDAGGYPGWTKDYKPRAAAAAQAAAEILNRGGTGRERLLRHLLR